MNRDSLIIAGVICVCLAFVAGCILFVNPTPEEKESKYTTMTFSEQDVTVTEDVDGVTRTRITFMTPYDGEYTLQNKLDKKRIGYYITTESPQVPERIGYYKLSKGNVYTITVERALQWDAIEMGVHYKE